MLALATLALALGPPAFAQEKVDGDVYANPRYGIQIAKPRAWHFITAGMILDLVRRTAGGAARAPAGDDPVKAMGFAVIVSKVPTLGRGFDPQVVLLVHEVPNAPPDLLQACEKLRSGMTDPQTLLPSREIQVDGKPAIRLDFQGAVDGAAVRATAICAIRGGRAFVVVGQALATEFDAEALTFSTVLDSFRLR